MNWIHDTAIIGKGVELGGGNVIGPNSVLLGPLRIGDQNWIGPNAVIGSPGHDWRAEHVRPWDELSPGDGIAIGDGNIIREFVSIHQPVEASTVIGNGCFLMAQAQVSHDCAVADDVTLSTRVALAGHCSVGVRANLGIGVQVHQGVKIGGLAMIGMGSTVLRDVPPFTLASGFPARLAGLNTTGLERAGVGPDEIAAISGFLQGEPLPDGGASELVTAIAAAWAAR